MIQKNKITISKGLKKALIILSIGIAVMELVKLVVLSTGMISYQNVNAFRYFQLFIGLVGFAFFILKAIYFNKKGYIIARNTYLVFFIGTFLVGLYMGLRGSNIGMNKWADELVKLTICLELVFYLSLVFSNAKESTLLYFYGIVSAIIIAGNTIITWSTDLRYDGLVNFAYFLVSLMLIPLFMQERVAGESKERDDLLD